MPPSHPSRLVGAFYDGIDWFHTPSHSIASELCCAPVPTKPEQYGLDTANWVNQCTHAARRDDKTAVDVINTSSKLNIHVKQSRNQRVFRRCHQSAGLVSTMMPAGQYILQFTGQIHVCGKKIFSQINPNDRRSFWVYFLYASLRSVSYWDVSNYLSNGPTTYTAYESFYWLLFPIFSIIICWFWNVRPIPVFKKIFSTWVSCFIKIGWEMAE